MSTWLRGGALVLLSGVLSGTVLAQKGVVGRSGPPPVEASALTSIPVRELAVFKDGHAFVLHESEMDVNAEGDVVLDTLPTPVIGTFWPYSADARARLKAVVAGKCIVRSQRTAMTIAELLDANIGAEVIVNEHDGPRYRGVNLGRPTQPPKTDAPASRAVQAETTSLSPPAANMVLLKLPEGTKVLPLERIRDLTFLGEPGGTLPVEDSRSLLTMKLDWGKQQPAARAKVGLVYLQKGVRWIPSYRVEIDGAGNAKVKLQATLINELADLHDTSVHLVIGVPSFFFKDTLDPIALQDSTAQLSQYFQTSQRMGQAFSNSIMTQTQYRMTEQRGPRPAGGADGAALHEALNPEIESASRHEDLFVFTLERVTLRKGERMVAPVAEFELPYSDAFALHLPFAPPPEVSCNVSGEQAAELARALRQPRVTHRVRLLNRSSMPLTTAPTMIVREGRLLAQSMMTYAAASGLMRRGAVDKHCEPRQQPSYSPCGAEAACNQTAPQAAKQRRGPCST